MSPQDNSWIAPWVAKKLIDTKEVTGASVLSDLFIRVERRDGPSFVVAAVSVPCVEASLIESLTSKQPRPSFILNVARESQVSAEALTRSMDEEVPIGRMGDLLRAVRLDDVTTYKDPEIAFVERGFDQHSSISSYERLDERRYRIKRHSRPSVIIALLNEYEVTADSVRVARERYGPFAWAVLTNPNSRITANAEEVSETLDCRLLSWREFYKAANSDDS